MNMEENFTWEYGIEGLCKMSFLMTNKHVLCFSEHYAYVYIHHWYF